MWWLWQWWNLGEKATFYQSWSLCLITVSCYFLCILKYYIQCYTKHLYKPVSNVIESTTSRIRWQKFWKKKTVMPIIKLSSNESLGINFCLIFSFQKTNKQKTTFPSYSFQCFQSSILRINMLKWLFFFKSNWTDWEVGNTNMIAKRIFIVQSDQNTNSFTKLHKYPGLPHFANAILKVLKCSIPK